MKTGIPLNLAIVLLLAACAPKANPPPTGIFPSNNGETPSAISSKTPSLTRSVTPISSPDPESTSSLEPISGEAEIEIEDFAFNPKTVTIKVGATVKWSNKDDSSHLVISDDGSWSSNSLSKGDSFIFTFTQAGTFSYHCGVHASMTGTIVVVSR